MKWTVEKEEKESTLLQFLKKKLGLSNKEVKEGCDKGAVSLNGLQERFSSTKLQEKDEVEWKGSLKKEKLSLVFEKERILYEDPFYLFYNKPPGIPSQGEVGKSVEKWLKEAIKGSLLCHRLDKETSGVLLFAKNEEAFKAMVHLFKEKKVKKSYIAILEGPFKFPKEGRRESYFSKKAEWQGQSLWKEDKKEKGILAISTWKVVKSNLKTTLIELFPETGRTHQLRVHMAALGTPILGDVQYGAKEPYSRYFLHALKLSFFHPFLKKPLEIMAPVPVDFKEIVEKEALQ